MSSDDLNYLNNEKYTQNNKPDITEDIFSQINNLRIWGCQVTIAWWLPTHRGIQGN